MKEIGEKLKEARESIAMTLEEASQDLKISVDNLQNIELGNKDSFDDIFYLKKIIKDYSKYLGLDYDEMVEEFNEYLFDFTSKISIDDIKKAEKDQKKKDKKLKDVKITSPYTTEQQEQPIPKALIIVGVMALVAIVIYVIALFFLKKDEPVSNSITYFEGDEFHEIS